MKELMSKILLGTAALTCPCHLPIFLIVFSGTALGAYILENMGLAAAILVGYFLCALFVGLKMVRPEEDKMRQMAEDEKYTREF